tara:strand:- start:1185 stop:2396 length:1212 start_codon:yes stop_codon:yes gene_type:complete
MKKTLIIFVTQPLNKFNYYKWGLNKKYNRKWNIKFWNLLNLENKDLNKKFSSKGHGIIKVKNFLNIKNISSLIKEFNKLPDKFFYINLSILSTKCSLIDRLLSLKGGKRVYFKMNILPKPTIPIKLALTYMLQSPYKLLYLKKILNYPFNKLISYFNSNLLLAKPVIYITPNEKAFQKIKSKNKIIKIKKTHSYDYELFMNNDSTKIKKKNYAVFIDEDVENHFDYTLTYSRLFNKGKYHLPTQWYWDKMEKFFSFIESTSKLKIIIAAHHRRSKNNFPIKRKFVFNKTLDLVKNSKLVLMHDSTALHQGILCQKPIILLNFNAYKKRLEQYLRILYFSKLTGAKVINLETFSFSKKNFNLDDYLKINIKQYKKYKDNYIKPPNSENIAIWKTVLGELDKLEN